MGTQNLKLNHIFLAADTDKLIWIRSQNFELSCAKFYGSRLAF